jgi:hypothetical protein
MSKYTIQRPSVIWVETVVQADDLEQARELADKDFDSGDYITMEQTFEIDYDRIWIQDETGKEFYV